MPEEERRPPTKFDRFMDYYIRFINAPITIVKGVDFIQYVYCSYLDRIHRSKSNSQSQSHNENHPQYLCIRSPDSADGGGGGGEGRVIWVAIS